MVRILVVDDSPTVREALKLVFGGEPDMLVVGEAGTGEAAVELAKRLLPDVITMDVNLPGMDGYAATRAIMETTPAPIVIVSDLADPGGASDAFRSLEAGALAILRKPRLTGSAQPVDDSIRELIRSVRLMSEVKVVKRSARFKTGEPAADRTRPPDRLAPASRSVRSVAVGASTGGPPALRAMLAEIPPSIRFPLFLAQHIAPGFLDCLLRWLSDSTSLPLAKARHGETARPGRAYFAPEGRHMTVSPEGVITLDETSPEHGSRPSVSRLFRSLAASHGSRAAAVLLSGMGRDGAREMLELRRLGALTVIQDQASAAIYGMPGEAAKLGAACLAAAPRQIGRLIATLDDHDGALLSLTSDLPPPGGPRNVA